MGRKRITEQFPWILPARKAQRKACFYGKMLLDGRTYAKRAVQQPYPYVLFEDRSVMLNESTGFPMEYQYNKVHNLKLAAATVNGIVIEPGQTFSFWKLVRKAEAKEAYKDGLTVINGRLTTERGGGLCQLSNLLFWLFLHSPLTVIERHPHRKREFPLPKGAGQEGTDAAVSEGWLDLKVKNKTKQEFQIWVEFDECYMYGRLLCRHQPEQEYKIFTRNIRYSEKAGRIFENCFVFRQVVDQAGTVLEDTCLYPSSCELGYEPGRDDK